MRGAVVVVLAEDVHLKPCRICGLDDALDAWQPQGGNIGACLQTHGQVLPENLGKVMECLQKRWPIQFALIHSPLIVHPFIVLLQSPKDLSGGCAPVGRMSW